MFKKILVANRGEIAVRVIRGIQQAGLRAVAVYSAADRHALHTRSADEAIDIGAASARDSYLAADKIISAAKATGAEAIHPGYGFFSESAEFAAACIEAGLVFIGPDPAAIQLMGNKTAAKQAMLAAGVPCIPGYMGDIQDDATLLAEAQKLTFPILVKAAAGGGGRGMRWLPNSDVDITTEIASARREAEAAFGCGDLMLEQAMGGCRHIEIQIAADQHGHVLSLGERDCSLQRRYQKLIEESPSTIVSTALREAMSRTAIEVAKACHYHGVGTVEFLVDKKENYYFLEMNTRLQVEHPVTELITGIDLVHWQLLIAAGAPLPLQQADIQFTGHAIEARLCAEDSAQDFIPQAGEILHWEIPADDAVRIDHGLVTGYELGPWYDSLLAKIIAWGPTREQARLKLVSALDNTHLLGVKTNKHFLRYLLCEPNFINGEFDTRFVDSSLVESYVSTQVLECEDIAAAAIIFIYRNPQLHQHQPDYINWSNSAPRVMSVQLQTGDREYALQLTCQGEALRCDIDNDTVQLNNITFANSGSHSALHYRRDNKQRKIVFTLRGNELFMEHAGLSAQFREITYDPASTSAEHGDGKIKAPTAGCVFSINVAIGESVSARQTLATVDAMKMEHPIRADIDGVVKAIHIELNTQVKKHQLLIELEPTAATSDSSAQPELEPTAEENRGR